MKEKIIGAAILALIVGAAIYFQFFHSNVNAETLRGYVGGEKINFLNNETIQKILRNKYGIVVEYTKSGSIEMVSSPVPQDIDFLWPSSQVAVELFKMRQGGKIRKTELIFNSPIVLYSWDIVADALEKNGIVQKQKDIYFIVDFPKLVRYCIEGKTWSAIGISDLYGKMAVISTDPTKSNSGNMFAGLLANMITGDMATEKSISSALPDLKRFFDRLGYMEHSSSDLFEQYLRTGVGAKPIIAGYENQIIEFSRAYGDLWPKVKNKIRILYPVPTVWSSHPIIILNQRAEKLIKALQDEKIQRIAWEEHGFRTGMIGVQNDPALLKVVGIPETINKVVPMPSPQVMDVIIKAIQSR